MSFWIIEINVWIIIMGWMLSAWVGHQIGEKTSEIVKEENDMLKEEIESLSIRNNVQKKTILLLKGRTVSQNKDK